MWTLSVVVDDIVTERLEDVDEETFCRVITGFVLKGYKVQTCGNPNAGRHGFFIVSKLYQIDQRIHSEVFTLILRNEDDV